ncbi:hypothetical protein HID58_073889 [Brassica napus]|uniref:Uncharacterized protein n=1 Tax=Brassica napus TaxID=3708 RepID=A0ABQ7YFD3_BRANA|nr:hypothetical protein HID58_073889 [Brassica napus]
MKTQIMLNRDDPKAKEDGSSSVGGEDMSMAMVTLSGEAIDKSVAPGTDQSPRDEESREVDGREKEKEAGEEGEKEEEGGEEGEKVKEAGDEGENKAKEGDEEMEPRKNDEQADERAIQLVRHTVSHAELAHAKSGQAHADSVEATGATPESAFEVMDGRLMNAVREAMKEVNEKVTSLSHKLALLEEEVKSLRLSDKPANQDAPQKKADQDAPQNSEDDESGEDDGSDNKESEEEDGSDSKDGGFIEDVTNENQGGDGDMDDTDAEMYAHAAEFERSLETKKKRPREDDGNEAVRAKSRFSPVGTRSKKAAEKAAAEKAPGKKAPGKKTPGKKAPAKKAAGKKAAGKKAAEEDAAQKKQKTKKTE